MASLIALVHILARSLAGERGSTVRPQRPTTRPTLEPLEERLVPSATVVDLTTRGSEGTVNEALFQQYDPTANNGVFDSFVRLHAANGKAVEQGYNTDHRRTQFNEKRGHQFTHALKLADVPVVRVDGVAYRVFVLDINQKAAQPRLSLDELRLYVGNAPTAHGYNATTKQLGGHTAVYDMDAGANSWVKLNARLNAGRGAGDMLLLVPDRLFTDGAYVTLYSKFGVRARANGGFEAWGVGPAPESGAESNGIISGYLFDDLDRNGVQNNGETGLSHQTVFLDLNDNGAFDVGDVSTTTDTAGFYSFTGLVVDGTAVYTVGVVTAAGWSLTVANLQAIELTLQALQGEINFGLAQGQGGGND